MAQRELNTELLNSLPDYGVSPSHLVEALHLDRG
jgi:hypothetical protein